MLTIAEVILEIATTTKGMTIMDGEIRIETGLPVTISTNVIPGEIPATVMRVEAQESTNATAISTELPSARIQNQMQPKKIQRLLSRLIRRISVTSSTRNQNLVKSDAADHAATLEGEIRTRGKETEGGVSQDTGQAAAIPDGRSHLKRVNLR